VHGMRRDVRGPCAVPYARTAAGGGLPTGTAAATAPRARLGKRELYRA
jgi:hypothetical protein